jgi:hypothetical protein
MRTQMDFILTLLLSLLAAIVAAADGLSTVSLCGFVFHLGDLGIALTEIGGVAVGIVVLPPPHRPGGTKLSLYRFSGVFSFSDAQPCGESIGYCLNLGRLKDAELSNRPCFRVR